MSNRRTNGNPATARDDAATEAARAAHLAETFAPPPPREPTPATFTPQSFEDAEASLARLAQRERDQAKQIERALGDVAAQRQAAAAAAGRDYVEILREELPAEQSQRLIEVCETLGLSAADVRSDLIAFRFRQDCLLDYAGPLYPAAKRAAHDARQKLGALRVEAARPLGGSDQEQTKAATDLSARLTLAEREAAATADELGRLQAAHSSAGRRLAALRCSNARIFADGVETPPPLVEFKRPQHADREYLLSVIAGGSAVLAVDQKHYTHAHEVPTQAELDLFRIRTL